MTFGESILSSAIGAFFGFFAALLIFFIREWWAKNNRRTAIIDNLKLELQYNINLYEKCANTIQECIESVSNNIRSVYLTLDYSYVAGFFARQFYNEGLLLKYFHPEDMRRWNVIITQIQAGKETYLYECVEKWRESKEITQEEFFNALKHEKSQINYAKEMTEYILKKL